jgi:hypothetical protein
MRTRALIVGMLAILAGCYNYVPVTSAAPPSGARANFLLTDAGTVEMARWVGPSTSEIEGEVVTADTAAITVAVRRLERRNGIEEYWKGEPVAIPRGVIATYTERRLSRSRTAMFGAGVVVAALALGQAFGDITGIFGRGSAGPGSEK